MRRNTCHHPSVIGTPNSFIRSVRPHDCPNALLEVLKNFFIHKGSLEHLKKCLGLVVPLEDLVFFQEFCHYQCPLAVVLDKPLVKIGKLKKNL